MSRQFQLSILVLLATFFSACGTAEDDAQNASGDLPTAVRAALETSQEGIEVRRMQVEIDATGRGSVYRFEFEDMNRIRYELYPDGSRTRVR